MKTVGLFTAIGTIIMSVAAATAPVANADVTVPIGPEQAFHGLVNGVHDQAQISVVCGGPGPFGSGPPRAGQTISVAQGPAPSGTEGHTGTMDTSVMATFFPSGARPRSFVFTTYNEPQPIPTDMVFPCSGSMTLGFVPQPFSDNAKEDQVVITFVSVGP